MAQQLLTVTDSAAAQIKSLIAEAPEGQPVVGLRIGVQAGGCSGMSYEFVVSDAVNPDDAVFEGFGAKAVVDPKADFFIGGSVVDYVESLMSSGFVVTNPQAVSTCSCGKSFST